MPMTLHEQLRLSSGQLLDLIRNEIPFLYRMVVRSGHYDDFERQLRWFIAGVRRHLSLFAPSRRKGIDEALEVLTEWLEAEGMVVHDFSDDKRVECDTLRRLYRSLRSGADDLHPDFLLECYHLFRRLGPSDPDIYTADCLKRDMARWPSGLDTDVVAIRTARKERMREWLVRKVETKSEKSSRYYFRPGMLPHEKRAQVDQWWNDHRFQLSMAIRSPQELNLFLDHTLPDETLSLLEEAAAKKIPFFITPYYISLLCTQGEFDDTTIREYIIYSRELVETFGSIQAWEKEDCLVDGEPNAAGWLLPNEHNIHRRYPEVAILIPDTMGRACGGLCAPCQRMYNFQRGHLNFNLEQLKPHESWDKKLEQLLEYFETDTQLRDVLITGGDALMSQNKTLDRILDAVCRMAERKREANLLRPDGEKYAELQRVRLGSRLPAYLPMRINDELIEILTRFRERAQRAGVSQFVIQTHIESPLEITPETKRAVRMLLSAGWLVTNQLVFTVGASRRGHTARLRRELNKLGIICYYTFAVKGFRENYAMYTPNSRLLQEQAEEKSFGQLPPMAGEFIDTSISAGVPVPTALLKAMHHLELPFLSTDRSVLNLPGIGKSMTCKLVGIMPDGRRIHCFSHDKTRRHSPVIRHARQLYIVENKAIAAYLRQLEQLGECPDAYASVWRYTHGETEPRFKMYEYPDFPFRMTERLSHLATDLSS